MIRYFAFSTLLLLAVAACGDDDPSVQTDAGSDAGQDVSTSEDCTGVVVAESAGAPCSGPCADGLQCTSMEGDAQPICRQVCVPDTCESVCGEDEVCAPLVDTPNSGVCAVPQAGERSAYESCGQEVGFCEDGFSCLTSQDANVGMCVPPCVDEVCEAHAGVAGSCSLIVQMDGVEERFCAPTCDAATACPTGMECGDSGICIW